MLKVSSRQSEILAQRLAGQRLRSLRPVTPLAGMLVECQGRTLVNFSSNDYLGLSQHSLLKERANQWLERYGAGCGASRLTTGNIDCYEELESKLAKLKGTESALILNSGFQTNLTVLAAVSYSESFILLDRYSHNSLLQGARLSEARWSRFRHNDLDDLQRRLGGKAAAAAGERWIVTESVFGMDGDRADIDALEQLARRNDAQLFIDEAHSTGVLGSNGMGLAAGKSGIDLIMGTFGKACGSFGSYVACSRLMRDYLINCCSGFVYSTGLPPPVLGAIDAALDLIPNMDKERSKLAQAADYVREQLQTLGYSTGASTTQIIPVIVGGDGEALVLSQHLEERGILALAIRPPTVPDGTARIRLSLSAAHTESQIEKLVDSFRSWKGND
jgi:8-amino-7-oxononanoate synthase